MGRFCIRSYSGAIVNPAAGLNFIFWGSMLRDHNSFKYLWIYTLGPYIGGLVAGLFFRFVQMPNVKSVL